MESQDLETPTSAKLQTELSIEKEADLLMLLEKAKTAMVGTKTEEIPVPG